MTHRRVKIDTHEAESPLVLDKTVAHSADHVLDRIVSHQLVRPTSERFLPCRTKATMTGFPSACFAATATWAVLASSALTRLATSISTPRRLSHRSPPHPSGPPPVDTIGLRVPVATSRSEPTLELGALTPSASRVSAPTSRLGDYPHPLQPCCIEICLLVCCDLMGIA